MVLKNLIFQFKAKYSEVQKPLKKKNPCSLFYNFNCFIAKISKGSMAVRTEVLG